MTDYYISDTHFGHANIIKLCNRPFADVDEMDRWMVEAWNARVSDEDDVWHLGDFSYKSARHCTDYLRQLNGRIHLIVGNHDFKGVLKLDDPDAWFASVSHAANRVDGKGRHIWMAHYPLAVPPKHVWSLYGHIHGDTEGEWWPLLRGFEQSLNCSVEVNGYMPVTFEELEANNERWRREQ